MPIPSLPHEIFDAIIDHLHDDQSVLLSCSQASSLLLPCSRYHLYSKVVLHSKDLISFLSLLSTPWNTISPVLHTLTIQGRRGGVFGQLDDTTPARNPPRIRHISRVIAHLQNVSSINIVRIDWGATIQVQAQVRTVLSNLRGVKRVSLDNSTFDLQTLEEYICSMPVLETLSFQQLRLLRVDGMESSFDITTQPRPHSPIHISTLDLSCIDNVSLLLKWFLSFKILPTVQKLCLHGPPIFDPAEVGILNQFIAAIGASLECLHIFFDLYHGRTITAQYFSSIDFSPCTHLRILRICGPIHNLYIVEHIIPAIVSRLSPTTQITDVSLDLYPEIMPTLPLSAWVAFFGLLQHPSFSLLQRVDIVLPPFMEQYEIDTSGLDEREYYSALKSRGVVVNTEFTSSRARFLWRSSETRF